MMELPDMMKKTKNEKDVREELEQGTKELDCLFKVANGEMTLKEMREAIKGGEG
jgi:Rod binding domain-containing protein